MRNQVGKFEYVKFFSNLLGLRKLFNYGWQFGLSPRNLRNLGFIEILIRLIFKGARFNRLKRGESGKRFGAKVSEVWQKE